MVKPTIPRDNFGMDATNNYNWKYIYIISLNVSRSYKFSLCDAMLILESQLVSAKFEATTFTHEYQNICLRNAKGPLKCLPSAGLGKPAWDGNSARHFPGALQTNEMQTEHSETLI